MSGADLPVEVRDVLAAHPDVAFVEAYLIDINGVARGKRLSTHMLARLYEKGMNLPATTPLLDIWGREVEGTGLIRDTGDADKPCRPVPGSLRPVPWARRPGLQLLLSMHEDDDTPFVGDPRAVLDRVIRRLADQGLRAVVATELEFRLFEADPGDNGEPVPARRSSQHGRRSQLLGLSELEDLDSVLGEIESACGALGLPVDTLIAEQGEAQYEINLEHIDDAMLAADQAVLLKRTIKAVAWRHGLAASFMAKPFGDSSGNGMHVHASLIDDQGHNVFADDDGPGSRLMACVGGLLATMADATAIFAPHNNSFRRFLPGSHAPHAATWGVDNRTTALRLPLAAPAARRIEHRVAGADANPYLVLAAVLAGMDHGMRQQIAPPPETRGESVSDEAEHLPNDWGVAVDAFSASSFIAGYFGATFQDWYAAAKRQEREHLRRIVPAAEHDAYLCTV